MVLSVPYDAHRSSLDYKMVMMLLGGFKNLEGLMASTLQRTKHNFDVMGDEGRIWHKENKCVDQTISQVILPSLCYNEFCISSMERRIRHMDLH